MQNVLMKKIKSLKIELNNFIKECSIREMELCIYKHH
ncbi:DUF603 domain-containing protein [Borreliella burgdorferi]